MTTEEILLAERKVMLVQAIRHCPICAAKLAGYSRKALNEDATQYSDTFILRCGCTIEIIYGVTIEDSEETKIEAHVRKNCMNATKVFFESLETEEALIAQADRVFGLYIDSQEVEEKCNEEINRLTAELVHYRRQTEFPKNRDE